MFCTNCGKELNPGDRFCANCGCEIKASQTEKRKYDNVVFNPPFRMEADKRTAQILSNRGEFNGFKEIAKENSQRNTRSKAKMDWNLDGFPESVTTKNKSGFDWGSVVERRNSGRSMGPEKIDLSATIEHKKVDDTQIEANKAETSGKDNLGLPPEDSRVISLEELEKELYDLEEDLKSDTAGTNQYQAFDPQDDDELDAYLDGLPKTKKKEKDAEEEKLEAEALAAVKMGGPMKWNLTDDAPRGSKVSKAPMGLVWGIDPDEVAAKRKAAKAAAKKETVMVWDTDSKAEDKKAAPEPAAEEPAAAEPVQTAEPVKPEPAAEPEPVKEPAGFAVPEHHQAAAPEYEPFEIPEFKPFVMPVTEVKEEAAPEEPVHAEPEPAAEPVQTAEPVQPEPAAEPEKPFFEPEVPSWTEETVKEEPAPETEVEDEFNDMLLHEGDDDLEKTRMIDHSEIKKMLDEYKKKLEEEEPETQDGPAEEIFAAEEPAEEKQEEVPAAEAGIAAAAGRVLYQEDLIHPWEKVAEEEAAQEEVQEEAEEKVAETEEPAPETAEETETPETEEPAEEETETAEEPVEEEPAEEESSEEEPAEETPEVTEAPAEDESAEEAPEAAEAPAEEKPMFYTFSRQNDAFQQLLQKERDRLNGLGTEYVPLNTETKIEKFVNAEDKPAYEENGVFVEGIVQPSHVPAADMSGDAISETSKQKFMTDGDWLRELRSAKDIDSLNRTKLRYSDLFPTPAPAHNEKEYGPADDEESLKEKQKKAEELNRIFEEEEQEEKKGKKGKKEKKDKEDKGPKKHIVGNIIMVLLILLILFEGSVLAAKLIAPDSKYAHISDTVVEKVMNLISGEKDSEPVDADTAEETDIEDISIEDTAYMTMIDNLSKEAKTIGQVVYNDDLNYSLVEKSGFEGVESMNTLTDSEWTKDGDTSVTYAGGIFASVINYYDEWKSRNTNEDLVGIDSLELGEIKQGEDGYYILTKTTYAAKDGSKAISYQTSHVTIMDGTMFIDEIKGETVNG